MNGLDTNVLVRFLTGDDPHQSPIADKLMRTLSADNPGFITSVAMVETFWVLKRAYQYTQEQICSALEPLLHLQEIEFEHPTAVIYAFHLYRNGRADFADALIGRIALLRGCKTTFTFDTGAARLADFTVLE